MALSKVKGYEIVLTVDGMSIIGTTNDTFSGGGVLKESIQKSDAGQTQYSNAGYEGNHSVNAFVYNGSPASTGEMNIETLMLKCATNATGAFEIDFGGDAGDKYVTGSVTFLSCSVTSDSENYAECTVDFSVTSKPGFPTI
jgi:hypothetical protein